MRPRRQRVYPLVGALCGMAAAVALPCLGQPSAGAQTHEPAENNEISARRAAEIRSFTDAQIIDGFLKVTFGAEFNTAGRIDRIRKFDVPVRAYIDNRGRPDRTAAVGQVIADIGRRIDRLDIALTKDRRLANLVITLVRDRDLNRTITGLFGRARAQRIETTLEPQCLSGFRKDETYRITRSEAILVVDAGDFIFYDCAYEEILQALGPINDDESVPWTMFNDNVQMGFFDLYDQYLLNLLYHPRMRPGMNREEAAAVVSEIMPEVRAFVARTNGLKE
jgi:Protein of unknown function (DUF2927)